MLKPLARNTTAFALIFGTALGTPCVLIAPNAAGVADAADAADAAGADAWPALEAARTAAAAVLTSWAVPATNSGNPTIDAAMPRAVPIPCLASLPDNVASVLTMKDAAPNAAAVAPTVAPTTIAVAVVPIAAAVVVMAAPNPIVGAATAKPTAAIGGANKAAATTMPSASAATDIPKLTQNMVPGLKPPELRFLLKSSSDRVCPVLPML